MVLTLWLALSLFSSAFAAVGTYFNQRASESYIDPFRDMKRPGDNLEAVILRELDKAETSIYIAVQELRLPEIAKKLVEKKKAGVDVRVVLENTYNHNSQAQNDNIPEEEGENGHDATRLRDLIALVDINRDGEITQTEMLQRDAVFIMQRGNIPVRDDSYDGSAGSSLMHHKFIVIDNKTVVVSSANFTPSCIHGDILVPNSRGNANALMVYESKPMAKLFHEEFSFLWQGLFGMKKPFRGARTLTVDGKKVTVQFSPSSRSVDWRMSSNGLIAKTLASAKTSIDAALFVFSEQRLADAMRDNAGKVDISVLVEPKFAFRPYSELLDLFGVSLPDEACVIESGNNPWDQPTLRSGIPILNAGDVLHHKFAVVDHKKVIFGSHNWSQAANSSNDEFLLLIDDANVATQFTQEHQRISAKAHFGLTARMRREVDEANRHCFSK